MGSGLTIDELARLGGTTGRQVRALQTRGLLDHPTLVGRTGFYGDEQLRRLQAILRLQRDGFSLAGIAVLLRALAAGMTLEQVVGLPSGPDHQVDEAVDEDEEFGGWPDTPKGQLLSVVPANLLDLSMAS
ncbi:MAG TPA: MerR family transcriptional regulator [Acidimicrobiales bacterium]|nr:MerR family transcriptional regulator [Acidimicrobiales bacterium]